MRPTFRIFSKFITSILLFILIILWGCAPTNAVQPTETSAQPTESEFQAVPTEAAPTVPVQPGEIKFQADLTAAESTVKVFKSTDVQQDQTLKVQVGDRIELNKESRSILNFPNFMEVELFRNAIVLLGDIRQESGGSTDITLNLNQGHMFVRLDDKTFSRVTVETPYAIIKALEDGTDFDICHNEVLTCVWIKKGSAEVIAKANDQNVFIREGEASYIKKDQPPSPAICAPLETFIPWEEAYRSSADTPLLGKVVAGLPQEPCPPTIMEIPADANILYEDDFTNPSSGWLQGTFDNYLAGYSESKYYNFQILDPEDKFSVPIPSREKYSNVNIDLAASTQSAQAGDFRYGIVFRRSGDQYYAFAISPSTKMWHVLKSYSSGTALEILKQGTESSIRGLDDEDGLRVTAEGGTFFFYINGRLVGEVSDSDYASGEVGLFVEALDSSEVSVRFNSITLWNSLEPQANPSIRAENCFNNRDDDVDGLIDRADPDCEKPRSTATSVLPTQPQPTQPQPTQPQPTQPQPTTYP